MIIDLKVTQKAVKLDLELKENTLVAEITQAFAKAHDEILACGMYPTEILTPPGHHLGLMKALGLSRAGCCNLIGGAPLPSVMGFHEGISYTMYAKADCRLTSSIYVLCSPNTPDRADGIEFPHDLDEPEGGDE